MAAIFLEASSSNWRHISRLRLWAPVPRQCRSPVPSGVGRGVAGTQVSWMTSWIRGYWFSCPISVRLLGCDWIWLDEGCWSVTRWTCGDLSQSSAHRHPGNSLITSLSSRGVHESRHGSCNIPGLTVASKLWAEDGRVCWCLPCLLMSADVCCLPQDSSSPLQILGHLVRSWSEDPPEHLPKVSDAMQWSLGKQPEEVETKKTRVV